MNLEIAERRRYIHLLAQRIQAENEAYQKQMEQWRER